MSIGPDRAKLRTYLAGNKHGPTDDAGANWVLSGDLLADTATAMRKGAEKVRDGNGTSDGLSGETAKAVLAAFATSATSMQEKGTKIRTAGEALQATAEVMRKAEEAEAKMAVLEQPDAYTPPSHSPGYQPTSKEITAEGVKRSTANDKLSLIHI